MTAPRRALPPPPRSAPRRLFDWFTTTWQAAALAAACCLLAAGLWPAPSLPPEVPAAVEDTPLVTPEPPAPATEEVPPRPRVPPTTAPEVPEAPSLRLPTLGVTAPLGLVDVRGGELEIPADPARVGMWRGGASPGDAQGTVLVTGHVSWNGKRGALWPLASAGVGDPVELVSPDGQTSHWLVTSVERLPRDADHPGLFSSEGEHRLVLVTCGGPVVAGNYRDLVAVVASPL